MNKERKNQLREVFGIDDVAKNGVFCVGLTAEDEKVFAEHAKARKQALLDKQKK